MSKKGLGVFANNRGKSEWGWECNRIRSQNHAKVYTIMKTIRELLVNRLTIGKKRRKEGKTR